MFNTDNLNELSSKLLASLPSGLQRLEKEIQQQFNEILQTGLTKLNLITREEFDIQVKVLARTREKLEHLQKQLDELQQQLKK